MYSDARIFVKKNRYTSISELFRDALRKVLYPDLTVNGFTEEFENMVLESAKEPISEGKVFETEDDIDRYFKKLIKSKK